MKKLATIIIGLSLLTSLGTYREVIAQNLTFIDIDLTVPPSVNAGDFPFGIECGDPESVYVTIFNQGLLAKINKITRSVTLINDPEIDPGTGLPPTIGQDFFSIARDPTNGNLFINERTTGELWRFAPSTSTWTKVPMIEQIFDSSPIDGDGDLIGDNDVVYINPLGGYFEQPALLAVNMNPYTFTVPNFGTIVYTSGNIYVSLSYFVDFDPPGSNPLVGDELQAGGDRTFAGLVKINPTTLSVTRIAIPGSNGNSDRTSGLSVDVIDPTIIWVADRQADKLYRFDTKTGTFTQTIDLDPTNTNSFFPMGVANDFENIYVALNELQGPGKNSIIAKVSRTNFAVSTIDTTAPNNLNAGTFTVFVNNAVLVWTDQSRHVGTIDLHTNQKTVLTTTGSTDSNHFGCVPIDTQFWFAGQGSAKVGILPNSKFSVGRPISPSGGGGGRVRYIPFTNPDDSDYDSSPPVIEEVVVVPGSVKLYANILDNVGVKDASIAIDKNTAIDMKPYEGNPLWWAGTIPSSDLPSSTVFFKIVARDFNDNIAEYSGSAKVEGVSAKQQTEATPSAMKTKVSSLTTQTSKVDLTPNNFIELSTITDEKTLTAYSDTILIKNNSNSTLESVRIMLSPEISKSFYVDKSSIRSIEPNGNATVNIKLFGSPNKDVYGKVTAYDGNVMVMAPNYSPVMLPVKINFVDNLYYQAYMDKVAALGQQRYRMSLINSLLPHPAEENKDFEATSSSGRNVTSASDELVIKNASGKQINNVRIIVSKLGNAFLLDRSNIKTLAPNESVTVQLIPKMGNNKYSPKDFVGEIIVVADNGLPTTIPVRIKGEAWQDSINEFEVRTVSESNVITTAVDTIHVKNVGNRTMDSVKIMLSDNLARIFSLDKHAFRTIAPGEEITVEVKYNTKDLKTFMQNYNGEIKIVSEHHNIRTIPIKMQWNKVENDNFVIYVRSADLPVANDILNYLKSHYTNVTSVFGADDHKATIYMTGNMEEMKIINPSAHPYYSYTYDTIFVCTCDNPKENALQEFIYRAMLMNFPSYYNMKKIENDNGNWLIDGMAKYVTVKNGNETRYIDAFKEHPTGFQWYGPPTDSQYGATITFFKYLQETYEEDALNRSLYRLGSGMVSNTRCDTVENCAVLWGVYDANGWDINKKHYTLDVKTLISEWEKYVEDYYGMKVEK